MIAQFSSIWPIDMILSGATTPGKSGPWSNGNEGVYCIPQYPSITGASPSDYFESYQGYSLVVVLTLYIEAVDVFCSPSRLDKLDSVPHCLSFLKDISQDNRGQLLVSVFSSITCLVIPIFFISYKAMLHIWWSLSLLLAPVWSLKCLCIVFLFMASSRHEGFVEVSILTRNVAMLVTWLLPGRTFKPGWVSRIDCIYLNVLITFIWLYWLYISDWFRAIDVTDRQIDR